MSSHRVAVLALDGVLPIDLGIPTQIFNPRATTSYEMVVCGDTERSLTTSAGFTLGLNAGLEVVSTDIPQARFMANHLHVVSDVTECMDTLAALQAGKLSKQADYTPITWEQRADRLVEIIRSRPRR